jgi:hypothetical protein
MPPETSSDAKVWRRSWMRQADAQVEHLQQDFAEAVRPHRNCFSASLDGRATGNLAQKPIDIIRLDSGVPEPQSDRSG